MKKIIICLSLMLAVAFTPALAQLADQADLQDSNRRFGLGINPSANPFSLLDFSKMTWSHSYSVSFLSANGGSGTVGMLNSTMMYEFSSKLSLGVNLNLVHAGGSLYDGSADATLLPGFSLDYHPSEKFRMNISFQRYSASNVAYFGRRYQRSSYFPY